MKRLGILASHQGTNFQAIIDACESGQIRARPVIAISNNSQSMALARATRAGIPAHHLSCKTHADAELLDQAMLSLFESAAVDMIITAGYMKRLGTKVLNTFHRRIVNIHPSLLPKHGGQGMYGLRVHQAVIDQGDAETGITMHYVDAQYDTGPIIRQRSIPVLSTDTTQTLAARLIKEEHKLLISTLAQLVLM